MGKTQDLRDELDSVYDELHGRLIYLEEDRIPQMQADRQNLAFEVDQLQNDLGYHGDTLDAILERVAALEAALDAMFSEEAE